MWKFMRSSTFPDELRVRSFLTPPGAARGSSCRAACAIIEPDERA